MKLARQIRGTLIFAGVAAGLALFFVRAAPPPEVAKDGTGQVAEPSSTPVVLHTARPPRLRKTPLSEPISLGSSFGRNELTGEDVARVPASPLDELDFDRRWDVNLALRPPDPPSDLPPSPASDEIKATDEADERPLVADFELGHLEPKARAYAGEALASLQSGTRKLKEGLGMSRRSGREGQEGQDMIREAAELLRDARDKLYLALRIEPQDSELLRMMQKAKANLYVCLKHGNY